ncbi:MAG: hypothetical protein ACKVZ6_06965 [Kineosporiaceae bacterium]
MSGPDVPPVAVDEPSPAPLAEVVPAQRGPSSPLAPLEPLAPLAPLVPSMLGAPLELPALPAGRSETARAPLAAARLRGAPAPDVVVFTATCPGCGRDAQWQEVREDTRLRATVHCDCA